MTRRAADLGAIPGLAGKLPAATSLEIFRQICFNRAFELEVARIYDTGAIKAPVYLSVGQEHIPAAIAAVSRNFLIFAQHRAHSYYLSFGGNPGALVDELLHRATGCAGGMGGSASIHAPTIGMFGHSGFMGDQVPIAVGAALGSGRHVLTVMGDASGEEDYVYGAMGYAATKRLPVLFVCEDNDLSILTPVATRRSWSLVDVARAVGLTAVDITDDPWLIAHHVESMLTELPAFLNVRTCRNLWHAGTGRDGAPEWDRFALITETLERLGLAAEAARIGEEARQRAARIWDERSPRP
jgi:TPP-dependent pyruvate/acetoin dehydrogenase alpha subunit